LYQPRLRSSSAGRPQVEVRGVPVVHFQVELAEPTVAGESGFLRGHAAGALDGGEVLGEDDASLQFAGARVGCGGEIDGGAGSPEGCPVPFGDLENGCGLGAAVVGAVEGAAERKVIACGSQNKTVRGLLRDGGCVPRNADGVGVPIQPAVQVETLRRGRVLPRGVLLRVFPISGIHGAGAEGELEDYGNAALDPDRDHVFFGMAASLHRDLLPAPFELAVQRAAPQVEGLLNEVDVFGLVDGEADAAQVKAVRILAEPVEELLLSVARRGVAHFAAESVEFGEA
jgi:hypothetical protein